MFTGPPFRPADSDTSSPDNGGVKVALVAESFLPHTNGVTHSLLRVIDHLSERGHEALVIAPGTRDVGDPVRYGTADITRLPSVGWPGYADVRVSLSGTGRLARVLEDYAPDVVHLASPFMLGWSAVKAAGDLNLPTVAVYQTEVPSYADRYGASWGKPLLWNRVRQIHGRADLTLAPSTYAMDQLAGLGVPRVRLWPRGVDAARFHPSRRDDEVRRRFAPEGGAVVGYVGRLAVEKRVEDLARLSEIPGVSLVIVGEGPMRARLQSQLPRAHFTGFLGGEDLARAVASFDLFVHCGEFETFCQTIQEALASGVPVVAPRRGGPIDLVDHGTTGFLYTPGRLDEMVARVRSLVADAPMRARFGARARLAVEHRTWPEVCDALVGHYDDVIGARRLPGLRPGSLTAPGPRIGDRTGPKYVASGG